jgi:hypothetical protein
MMETKIEVPSQVRELVAISIDSIEKALALFFDAATKSIAPNSLESIERLKRVVAVKWITPESLRSRATSQKRPHCSLRIADHKWKSRQILFV